MYCFAEKKGADIELFHVGHFMTSIDMAGFNMNVTKLNSTIAHCLHAYTEVAAWKSFSRLLPGEKIKPDFYVLPENDVSETTETEFDDKTIISGMKVSRKLLPRRHAWLVL